MSACQFCGLELKPCMAPADQKWRCEECDDGDPNNESHAAVNERHHELGESGA